MIRKRLLASLALIALLCFSVGIFVDLAYAQDSKGAKISDKRVAEKRGVASSLAQRKKGEEEISKGPSKLQMGIGVGSIFVMIAVVKWL